MFVFIVYPKMDNRHYTYLQFVPNAQQNVSICAHRRLQKKRNTKVFLFFILYELYTVIPDLFGNLQHLKPK